jgi:D-inositol-3-phosphate glycosyltransferase
VKHVVIAGPAHPLRGGLAAFGERLGKAFQDEGCRVTLLSFSLQYPNFLFPGKSQYTDAPPPEGLRIESRINSINPLNWIRTGIWLRKQRPDVVIFKYWIPFMAPCLGTIARIVRGNGHTQVMCILDNVIPHEKRIGDGILTRYFIRSIDRFIAMSKQVMEELLQFTNTSQRLLVPHPIYDHYGKSTSKEIACEKLGLDPTLPYLLFFGFIRAYKGLDLLLKAIGEHELHSFPGKLIIAGEFYEDEEPYMDLIRNLGIEDKIILRKDYIPDEEVAAYFCAADLLVQPYHTATQSGISQMAFHFDKPMIVTRVGGLPEIVLDGISGFVVDKDPASIAKAIARTYSENRIPDFTAAVREEKKKYDWHNMTSAVWKLCKT